MVMYNLSMKSAERKLTDLTRFDVSYREDYITVAGVDEAGRGPLSGPVVAAAVITLEPVDGVYDSKSLCRKEREYLYDRVMEASIVGIGVSSPEEIDLLNILAATRLAMNRALNNLSERPNYVLVDGKSLNLDVKGECIVGGDRRSASIASASIVAKVFRDRIMDSLDILYPEYGYRSHKGYGTEKHLQALRKYGPTTWHRLTFRPIRELITKELATHWSNEERVGRARLFRAGMVEMEAKN
ncbi:ribonuclease HII [Mesotoga sp. B105.6.4]|nr:ribonuclease HII [Mesotoga sp. B105.6.4]